MIDAMGAGDRAGLVALGGPADRVVVPAAGDLLAVRQLILDLAQTDAPTDLQGGFEAVAAQIRADQEHDTARNVVVVLSDFRKGSADISAALPASFAGLADVQVLASEPASDETGNVQIVGVEPLQSVVLTRGSAAAQQSAVRVSLRRTGSGAASAGVTQVSLHATGDGLVDPARPPTQGRVRWERGQSQASVILQVEPSRAGG